MFVPTSRSPQRRRAAGPERSALFPGYIFCRFDRHIGSPIITTSGVMRVVGSTSGPIPLEEAEIDALRRVAASDTEARPWPYISSGQRVILEDGPLAGIQGLVLATKSHCRVAISVELLRRSIAVEVERHWIRPIQAACALLALVA